MTSSHLQSCCWSAGTSSTNLNPTTKPIISHFILPISFPLHSSTNPFSLMIFQPISPKCQQQRLPWTKSSRIYKTSTVKSQNSSSLQSMSRDPWRAVHSTITMNISIRSPQAIKRISGRGNQYTYVLRTWWISWWRSLLLRMWLLISWSRY